MPLLLRGENVKPSSGLGTNAGASQSVAPKAVIVGAGFSKEELDEMRQMQGCEDLPWLYPSPIKSAGTGFSALVGKDFMASVVERSKATMKQNGLVEGKEGQVKPDVWGF